MCLYGAKYLDGRLCDKCEQNIWVDNSDFLLYLEF